MKYAIWIINSFLASFRRGDFDILIGDLNHVRALEFRISRAAEKSIYSILKDGEELVSRRSYEPPSQRRLPDLFTEEFPARRKMGKISFFFN